MGIETAKELLDFIYPNHSRISCNDNNITNGFYSNDVDGSGRCTRCMFLEILKGRQIPKEVLDAFKEGLV